MRGIRVSVESVEQVGDTAVWVVRCLEGPVSLSDVFDVDDRQNVVQPRITAMWRYDWAVDLIEPSLSAKLELTGPDVALLSGARELRGSGPV